MRTYRGTAVAVGVFFILATVPFSISVAILEPLLSGSDYLARLAGSPSRVALGSLLEVTNHISVVMIAVLMYPVLKPFGERVAVGYVVARSIESVLFLVATMQLLALAKLSTAFVSAGSPSDSPLVAVGELLFAGHDWNRVPLAFTAFALGALLLNYTLYRTRLVPRWIAGFGLLAAASILAARVLHLAGFGLPTSTVTAMDAPIFLQEMVFAVWLIAKGFDQDVLASARSGPTPQAG